MGDGVGSGLGAGIGVGLGIGVIPRTNPVACVSPGVLSDNNWNTPLS
jgi:hypothetical protein